MTAEEQARGCMAMPVANHPERMIFIPAYVQGILKSSKAPPQSHIISEEEATHAADDAPGLGAV